jgi:hypothetical protein
VVLDPALGLVIDAIPCEDGHARERSLLDQVLETVAEWDLWVADRNFCTTDFLFGIARRGGGFVIRRHAATLSWDRESDWRAAGRTDRGTRAEQSIWLTEPGGEELAVRRIRLTLDRPTRDGDGVNEVLTNLPAEVAAATVAELYRGRWSVEGLFLRLTTVLKCKVNTLGYPPAALFGFCVALAAGSVYAGVTAAVREATGRRPQPGCPTTAWRSRYPWRASAYGSRFRGGVSGDRREVGPANGGMAGGPGPGGGEPGPLPEGDPRAEEATAAPYLVRRSQAHHHRTAAQG